jgi:hypothetical protein
MLLTPKNQTEFRFLYDLLKKLGTTPAVMTNEEMEDIGFSKLMKAADKTKKISRETIMAKLDA